MIVVTSAYWSGKCCGAVLAQEGGRVPGRRVARRNTAMSLEIVGSVMRRIDVVDRHGDSRSAKCYEMFRNLLDGPAIEGLVAGREPVVQQRLGQLYGSDSAAVCVDGR
jgi:hypothetical protein